MVTTCSLDVKLVVFTHRHPFRAFFDPSAFVVVSIKPQIRNARKMESWKQQHKPFKAGKSDTQWRHLGRRPDTHLPCRRNLHLRVQNAQGMQVASSTIVSMSRPGGCCIAFICDADTPPIWGMGGALGVGAGVDVGK